MRIDDLIYREAKAEAARRGITLTRFIEEALRQRLRVKEAKPSRTSRFKLPVVSGGRFAAGIQNLDQALKVKKAPSAVSNWRATFYRRQR